MKNNDKITDDFMFNAHWGLSDKIDRDLTSAMKEVDKLRDRMNYEFGLTIRILRNLETTFLWGYINGINDSVSVSGNEIIITNVRGEKHYHSASTDATINLIDGLMADLRHTLIKVDVNNYELKNSFIGLEINNRLLEHSLSINLKKVNDIYYEYKNRKPSITESI